MLSIIICSITPDCLKAFEQNVYETIDVEYEIIAIDNREKKWPIAKVYNYAAQQAKYPYLFFVHEDVLFHSKNWGQVIEHKLAEPDCGVIGFVGSKVKFDCCSGWSQKLEWLRYNYSQRYPDCTRTELFGAILNKPFDEVVVVDGFAMFVRKDVWEQNKYDEELLTGFHCYDIDFSLQIARNYKNYVCYSQILIEHFSIGNYNALWYMDTIKLYYRKWCNFLPMKTKDVDIDKAQMQKYKERLSYEFLFRLLRVNGVNRECTKLVLKDFWSLPFSKNHIKHCITCTLKYLRS